MPPVAAAHIAGALPDRLAPGAPVRLAAVAVVYAAYLCAYFVLGPAAFDAGGWYWHDLLVIVLTGALLLGAGLHSGPAMRRFLLWNAASMLPLLLSDLSCGRDLALWREPAGPALQLTDIAYVVFLFAWIWA